MNRRISSAGIPGVLLDLVQDLEGDFTASGSSRHDQVASPFGIHGRSHWPPRSHVRRGGHS